VISTSLTDTGASEPLIGDPNGYWILECITA